MCWLTRYTFLKSQIATLLGHDGSGKRYFGMITKKDKIAEIAKVIFKNGNPSSNAKDLHDELSWMYLSLTLFKFSRLRQH